MCSVRTITAPEAADLIVDGAVVAVSSSSGWNGVSGCGAGSNR